MYVVTVINKGQKFWLRGTTWAFRLERADKFSSRDAATEKAMKAERFMAASIRRKYKIESFEPIDPAYRGNQA